MFDFLLTQWKIGKLTIAQLYKFVLKLWITEEQAQTIKDTEKCQ